jgi:carboxylesterase
MKIILHNILRKTLSILLILVSASTGCCIYNKYIQSSMDEDDFITYKRQNTFAEVEVHGRSPAVLLIHGFGGSPLDYKPIEESLRKSGYAFKSILLPGHGTNPKDLQNTQMSDWLTKSFSEYESLKEKYGEVSVVGFSMGGTISLCIAAEKPVEKLVLISPYFKVKEQWARRLSTVIPFVRKLKMGQINDPESLEKYIAYNYLATKAICELATLGNHAREKAGKVRCETLWIHSRGDFVADFQLSREVFDLLPATRKTFIEYNKSNHIIIYDYNSGDATKNIISFLTNRSPKI